MPLNNINDSIIPDFLITPRYRIGRHVILLVSIAILSMGLKMNGEFKVGYYQYYEFILLFLVFTGVTYSNMYISAPRFLFKNKLGAYFLSLLGYVLLLLLFLSLSQFLFHHTNWNKAVDYMSIFFSYINATIMISIIITYSSTLIIFKNWIEYSRRIKELYTATLETEVQQLKNQINPHFLFNMLNNANIMVKHNPRLASQILIKLDDLLCYQIEDSLREDVDLNADIRFLTSYLDLEKIRRDRFNYSISKKGDMNDIRIPPLLFIPFVENAVKHSPDNKNTSYINISFEVMDNLLLFSCENSKPSKTFRKKDGGLGLANVNRRLELLYENEYLLDIKEEETTYTINLELRL